MRTCPNKSTNLQRCNCTYEGCSRKGVCCECLHYHLSKGEVPACFFGSREEATYNRSIAYFISTYNKR